ncbi:MAG: hypothetical protein H6807_12520 [Planctomycetes bacterium]|nr:hypothetical protein [Planctomycetota bacterium]
MNKVLWSLLLLLLALAVWVALGFRAGTTARLDAGGVATSEETETARQARRHATLPVAASGPVTSDPVRAPIGDDGADERFLIRVVEAEGGEPIAGAEVYLVVPGLPIPTEPGPRLRWHEADLRRLVRPLRSDDEGHCLIAFPPVGSRVFAFSATASAMAKVDRAAWREIRLPLDRDDAAVTVRTVAQDGRGLGGIPIILSSPESKSRGLLIGRSDPLDASLRVPLPDRRQRGRPWRVVVGGALRHEVAADLDPEPDDGTIIELVIPDHGSVRVDFVDPQGEPFPAALRFSQGPGDYFSFNHVEERLAAPSQLIEPVEVGATIIGTIRPVRQDLGRVTTFRLGGPSRPGELVIAEQVIEPFRRRAALRVLDREGRPLAATPLRLRLAVDGRRLVNLDVDADADGRLVFGFDPQAGARRAEVEVQYWHEGRLEGRGLHDFKIESQPDGTIQELGDLRLEAPSILAAGRVLDDEGRPLPDCRFRLSPDERRSRTWLGPNFRSDRHGRFELRGTIEATDFELTCQAEGMIEDRRRVVRGQIDLEIRLRPMAELRGRIGIPEGLVADDLMLTIECDPGTKGHVQLRADGSFRHVAPRIVAERLVLGMRRAARFGRQVLADDLALESGASLDLGLQAFELEARAVDLVFDPPRRGDEPEVAVVVLDPKSGDLPAAAIRVGERAKHLIVPRLPTFVRLERADGRRHELRLTRTEERIDLRALFGAER